MSHRGLLADFFFISLHVGAFCQVARSDSTNLLQTTFTENQSSSDDEPLTNIYIMRDPPCLNPQGFGAAIEQDRNLIDIAERWGMTYVCDARDWESLGHATGNLGFLIGCDGNVDKKSLASSLNLDIVQANISDANVDIVYVGTERQTLNVPLKSNTLYVVHGMLPGGEPSQCMHMSNYGLSYKWLRRQYNRVRSKDDARSKAKCWKEDMKDDAINIVLALRRGDTVGSDGMVPAFRYADVLKFLFKEGSPMHVPKERAVVTVIAEVTTDDKEIRAFDDLGIEKLQYWLGKAVIDIEHMEDVDGINRFVHDLDCMTSADILIAAGSAFHGAAAAMQKETGVTITLAHEDKYRDMPNSIMFDQLRQGKVQRSFIDIAKNRSTALLQFYDDIQQPDEWNMQDWLPGEYVRNPGYL